MQDGVCNVNGEELLGEKKQVLACPATSNKQHCLYMVDEDENKSSMGTAIPTLGTKAPASYICKTKVSWQANQQSFVTGQQATC